MARSSAGWRPSRTGSTWPSTADGNGFFGFFDSVDDDDVAGALLDAAAGWLRQRGLTGVRGPVNPTMNDVAGLLVDGFDRPPAILLPYNFPYYQGLLERWGMRRAMTMWAFYVHEAYINAARMARGAEIVARRNPKITVRPLDPTAVRRRRRGGDADLQPSVGSELGPRAVHRAGGAPPGERDEGGHRARHLPVRGARRRAHRVLGLIAQPQPGAPLPPPGPGWRRSACRACWGTWKLGGVYELRMALMGVVPEHRNAGLDALLIHHTIVNGRRRGYQAAELSWVLDSNKPLVNALGEAGLHAGQGVRDVRGGPVAAGDQR